MIEGMSFDERLASVFRKTINNLVEEYRYTKTLLLFQGVGRLLAHAVLENEHSIPAPNQGWFDSEDNLDLSKLAEASKHTFKCISASDDVVVGVYEQIMPIRGSLAELYDGKIVMVRNNLFSEKVPSAASPKYLTEFKKMLDNSDYGNDEVHITSKFYADVVDMEAYYLVTPIQSADELNYDICDLFSAGVAAVSNDTPFSKGIPAPGPVFLEFCIQLCEGFSRNATFEIDASLINGKECREPRVAAACSIMGACGMSFGIRAISCFDTTESDIGRLLPVLKKYWGSEAEFRDLSFYKNPKISNEMKSISQGYIADQVVLQSEAALEGSDSFRNIFVTAPTGAGKSVLFQIPALYLAERYDAVTVVVEPLIALMDDQIAGLRARGVKCATALNSSLSYSDRLSEIDRIKNGEISLVYLSPELLLGSSLEEFIGERSLGLLVVDEAHTVALWGKDFRSDYWFLGDYLSKLRRSGFRFPVFCLTATAVYGGADDIVFDVREELELGSLKLFLGNVRRDDLSFGITHRDKRDYAGPIESVKYQIMVERIKEALDCGKHTLVYCPFTVHVKGIVDAFYSTYPAVSRSIVMPFYGKLDKSYKDAASKQFMSGKCRVMVCTTAFGMGIDVDDVEEVLHYAPTGNLSNYVQEIGRGARRSDLSATAVIDFFASDSRYFAQLYGMSSLRQKQLKEVMKKIYALYIGNKPRRQNLLVAPNSFSYLFGDGSDAVNKTKTALMMIAKDLLTIYGFPVLVVKSKPSYTKNYVHIPNSIDKEFNRMFGRFARKVSKPRPKSLEMNARNKWTPELIVRDGGDTYELDSARMWEECFSNVTFGQFKWMLFNGEIIGNENRDRPSSRFRLDILYKLPFDQVCETFDKYMKVLQSTLLGYKYSGHFFTARQFKKDFTEKLGEDAPFAGFPEKVLDAFTMDPKALHKKGARSTIKCLQRKGDGPEVTYYVAGKSFVSVDGKYLKRLMKSKPSDDGIFRVYLSREKTTNEELDLAILLELFGLATYEARGGDDPELFVRLNDPNKINALANDPRYQNKILTGLTARHKQSRSLITKFFLAEMEDSKRWDLVESYFLGEGEAVEAILDSLVSSEGRAPKKTKKLIQGKGTFEAELLTTDCNLENEPFSKIWEYGKDDSDDEHERLLFDELSKLTEVGKFEKPIYAPELTMPSTGAKLTPVFAWPKAKVMLFLEEDAANYAIAQESNWRCLMTGSLFSPDELIAAIGQ